MKTYFLFQILLVQKKSFHSKTDESSFFKNFLFSKQNFSSQKCVLSKPFFQNKLRLVFSKKKKIFSNLLKHCWLKTFLRIAYLGICAYDSIPLNHKHQSSLHDPSHFLGTNTFPLSSFLHGKNENTWWRTTSCYPSNPLLYFFYFFSLSFILA